jgi:hypothetical protein
VPYGKRTPIYRLLHGAPMLAGIPAHYVLVLLGVATVFGLGVMSISKMFALGLAFIFGQDRARVPLMLLRLRYRFAKKLDSYSPSGISVRIDEQE